MLTGLLGNLSLLSYFAKKKETEAVLVQTLGVVSTYAVIAQLAMAEAMPLPHFTATSVVVASGLVLNFLYYFSLLHPRIWQFWEDFITIGGLSVLPQVNLLLDFIRGWFGDLSFLVPLYFENFFRGWNWNWNWIWIAGHVVDFCSVCSEQHFSWDDCIHCSSGCCCYGKRFLFLNSNVLLCCLLALVWWLFMFFDQLHVKWMTCLCGLDFVLLVVWRVCTLSKSEAFWPKSGGVDFLSRNYFARTCALGKMQPFCLGRANKAKRAW